MDEELNYGKIYKPEDDISRASKLHISLQSVAIATMAGSILKKIQSSPGSFMPPAFAHATSLRNSA